MLRMTNTLLRAVAGLALFMIASAASANSFTFVSQPGDWVGQGQTLSFTNAGAAASSNGNAISAAGYDGNHNYSLWISAPAGQQLAVGTYENAERYLMGPAGSPGMDFSGDGRGCNRLNGNFTITALKLGPYGYVETLEANWEQHCEYLAPASFGQVSIHNAPAEPELEITIVPSLTATVNRVNFPATVTGTITCSKPTTAQVAASLMQTQGRKNVAYGSMVTNVPCGPVATTWTGRIGSDSFPFSQGMGQLDVAASATDSFYNVRKEAQVSTVVSVSVDNHTLTTQSGQRRR